MDERLEERRWLQCFDCFAGARDRLFDVNSEADLSIPLRPSEATISLTGGDLVLFAR
jgi:hypothetical protein